MSEPEFYAATTESIVGMKIEQVCGPVSASSSTPVCIGSCCPIR
ncbi:MAG: hypothetical protein AAGI30_08350 [Planctomycetota bacterium]